MVCITKKHQKGSGILDNILSAFTFSRFPNERHAISLAPETFGKPFSFMGPGTNLDKRLNPDFTPKSDSLPINKSDLASYYHDIKYYKEQQAYNKDKDKNKHMHNIWHADDEFIKEMNQDKNEPMAAVAKKLIQTKENLEKAHLLPESVFSLKEESKGGSKKGGSKSKSTDPTARLKMLAMNENLTAYEPVMKNSSSVKKQEGGLAFLLPVAIAALSALGAKAAGDVYNFAKKKIFGSGITPPKNKRLTTREKKDF